MTAYLVRAKVFYDTGKGSVPAHSYGYVVDGFFEFRPVCRS